MSLGRLKGQLALKRAGDGLKHVRDVATALTIVGGKLTPLAVLGLATHMVLLGVSIFTRDISRCVESWHRLDVPHELHALLRRVVEPHARRIGDDWWSCDADGQTLLMRMGKESSQGEFFAERDAVAARAWLRARAWELSHACELVPVGPSWADAIEMRRSDDGPGMPSARADEAWAELAPYVRAGDVRSLLLDGMPRTGKSTVVRRLIELATEELGRPLKVLRIRVADFSYLRASSIAAAVRLLTPDVLVVDDLDRFYGAATLLDMFEQVRAHVRLVLTTCNDPTALPVALRMPGRIDQTIFVDGVGVEIATAVMADAWADLDEAERGIVARWPLGVVIELRARARRRGREALAPGVVELERLVAEALRPKTAAPANTEVKAA